MWVEQAVFTSVRSDRHAGYHLVATSPGVNAETAKELTRWGPAHDSLVGDQLSVNFHPLRDHQLCLSRTVFAGREYSGRKGERVYTQFFLIAPTLFRRFANQPFRVLEALSLAGHLKVLDEIPRQLERVRLLGKASSWKGETLAKRLPEISLSQLTHTVHAVSTGGPLALMNGPPARRLIDVLVDLLPIEFRPMLSFSTALRPSPRRPFRVVVLAETDDATQRRERARSQVLPFDVTADARPLRPADGWAYCVDDMLRRGRHEEFSRWLAAERPNDCRDLQEFARFLVRESKRQVTTPAASSQ